jgi:hypothetical protein
MSGPLWVTTAFLGVSRQQPGECHDVVGPKDDCKRQSCRSSLGVP